ncbi:MAG: hypothetical protein KAR06_06595 [Deltaproteobacteria bacterium]|nr:hypothetical protein [Deltaproteobacteria bacterium]
MKINKNVFKYVSKETHKTIKLLAAKGRGDLTAEDALTAVYLLTRDKDPEISDTARESFLNFRFDLTIKALEKRLDPVIIEKLTSMHPMNTELLVHIARSPFTGDETLQKLALHGNIEIVRALSENLARIKKKPFIYDAMKKNNNTPDEVFLKVSDFLGVDQAEIVEMDGKEVIDVAAVESKAAGATDDENKGEAAADLGVSMFAAATNAKKADEETPKTLGDSETEGHELSEEELDKQVSETDVPNELKNDAPEKPKNLIARLKEMNVAGKIKLALEGNKEVRETLVKSTNKLVYTAVLKSPRITDDEIIKLTSTKGTSEDILRLISRKREWMANYRIKHTLITNPKTPPGIAIKLLNHLNKKDIEKLAKGRGLSSALSSAAKKVLDLMNKK